MGNNLPAVNLGKGRTAIQIGLGDSFSCALLDNSTVKCWGTNGYAQLGQGDLIDRGAKSGQMGDSLRAISLGTKKLAKQIAVGAYHACALLDDSTVKCWGYNGSGALGLGDTDSRGDSPREMGDVLPAVNLGPNQNIVRISAGGFNTCALLDNQTVKCWGQNDSGELGQGDNINRGTTPNDLGENLKPIDLGTNDRAVNVLVGANTICAVLTTQEIKCWGNGSAGIFSNGLLDNRGNLQNQMGDLIPPLEVDLPPIHFSIGGRSACLIFLNYAPKCWGANSSGQLGLGDRFNRGDQQGDSISNFDFTFLGKNIRAVKTVIGISSACAVIDDGKLKCWGDNSFGQLGVGSTQIHGDAPSTMGDNLPFVDL
jgi:alpha-tubulin suppressor-like RCC1 family protein